MLWYVPTIFKLVMAIHFTFKFVIMYNLQVDDYAILDASVGFSAH